MQRGEVQIPTKGAVLQGTLEPAGDGRALVIFAHGSGSSRHSPRNREVAAAIRSAGIGTLLFDLLTSEEEAIDRETAHLRFDIGLLADRLEDATAWALAQDGGSGGLAVGYFGASTGAAAALIAAARLGERIDAVVSRGGRPDLAGPALAHVLSPTLLIVGERDREVLELNRQALAQLDCDKALAIVPGATHLFEERGALERVAALATQWFRQHLLDHPGAHRARRPGAQHRNERLSRP
jgi:putative phosphoribosyl transferase